MKYLSFLFLLLVCVNVQADFYSESKRGWFWFEDPVAEEEERQKKIITPEQAASWIENFKQELVDTRNIYFANPTPENAKKYMEAEERMWEHTFKIYYSTEMAKFLNPKLVNADTKPMNVAGVRIARDLERKGVAEYTAKLSQEYDLVLFRSSDCMYCEKFEPVLSEFGKRYGFEVEAVSADNTISPYFVTKNVPYLFHSLNIEATPTVVMVHKSRPIKFELMRGFLSMQELEDRFKIVKRYLEEQSV